MKTTWKYRLFICGISAIMFLSGCPDTVNSSLSNGTANTSQSILNMEMDAFDQVNDVRLNLDLNELSMNEEIRTVARAHSQDMLDNDFFDHDNLDGESPFDRMHNAGITYTAAGENIAMNRGLADPAEMAVDGWIDSPGHYANIINDRYTHTGMGVAGNDNDGYYFTQLFASFSKDAAEVHMEVYYTGPITMIAE